MQNLEVVVVIGSDGSLISLGIQDTHQREIQAVDGYLQAML